VSQAHARSAKTALVAVLLLAAPMAGCLQPVGEAVQDAVGDEGDPAGNTSAEASSGDESVETQASVEESYRAAFDSLDPETGVLEEFAVTMHIEPLADAETRQVDANFYLSVSNETAVVSFTNGTASPEQAGDVERFLIGAVHHTGFLGTPNAVMGTYNESGSWEDQADNLTQSSPDSATMDPTENVIEPTALFTDVEALPDEAIQDSRETTYEGREALEVDVHHQNETGTANLTVILDRDDHRPFSVEGTLSNASSLEGPARIEMSFAYGGEATHPLADELRRLETMTIQNASDASLTVSTAEPKTWTVQPSQNPGLIPLEEVEVLAESSTPGQGSMASGGETQLSLPAEEGQVESEDARLVYEDVDDDGHVSPGDEIRFTPLSSNATSWSVMLEDEKTGMRMVPAPAVALVGMVLVGVAAGVQRTRP